MFVRTLGGAAMAAKLRCYREVLGLSVHNMLLSTALTRKQMLEKVDHLVSCGGGAQTGGVGLFTSLS